MTDSFAKLGNVLVIDDDNVSNFIYTRVIKSSGSIEHIKSCMSGQEALEYLKDVMENNPEEYPEMIFLDINMPEMNGWEFLEHYMKEVPYNFQEQSILCMLTSSIYKEDVNKAKNYTVIKEYIQKPLTTESFKNVKNKYF